AATRPRCSARPSVATPKRRAVPRTKAGSSGAARRPSNIAPFRHTTALRAESQRAHDPAARPERTPDEERAGEVARAQGVAPAAGGGHPRPHPPTQQAQPRPPPGGPAPTTHGGGRGGGATAYSPGGGQTPEEPSMVLGGGGGVRALPGAG